VANVSVDHGFLESSVGGRFKNLDGTVPVTVLANGWIDDVALQYAGRSVNVRRSHR
jgi:hypothetical protein